MGTTTLSITTLGIMTFSIIALSITTIGVITLSIIALSIMIRNNANTMDIKHFNGILLLARHFDNSSALRETA